MTLCLPIKLATGLALLFVLNVSSEFEPNLLDEFQVKHGQETSAGLSSRKAKDDGRTGSCVKTCKSNSTCDCEVLKGNSNVKKWCTTFGICNYCAPGYKRCSFGAGPNATKGYVDCCDYENPMYKGKFQCHYSPEANYYKCLRSCAPDRSMPCTDKNGYRSLGYISCEGKRKNTFTTCNFSNVDSPVVECGAAGAKCSKAEPCCESSYFCNNNGVCETKCVSKGFACQPARVCCRHICQNNMCP